jgi:lysosomal Pro-X carboxypeptidase
MCSSYIRDGFKLISAVATQTGGFQKLSKVFRTCTPIASNDDVNDLIDWVTNAFTYLAMTDYPYATNFLQPLPAWPVKAACAPLVKVAPTDLLTAIYLGANVYYNTSGLLTCNTLSESSVSPSLGSAWDYQACTELTLNTAANGVTDMFPPSPFSIPALIQSCQSQFGVTPRVEWIPLWTGGWNITGASNIIFSNGLLDPWSGGGITRSLSDSLTAILIKDGAHHLDLRFSDPEDPPSVITARLQESNIIQDWLNKYYARIKNN